MFNMLFVFHIKNLKNGNKEYLTDKYGKNMKKLIEK